MNIKYTSPCGRHTDRILLRWRILGDVGFPLVINNTRHAWRVPCICRRCYQENIRKFFAGIWVVWARVYVFLVVVSWSMHFRWYPAPTNHQQPGGCLCAWWRVDPSERFVCPLHPFPLPQTIDDFFYIAAQKRVRHIREVGRGKSHRISNGLDAVRSSQKYLSGDWVLFFNNLNGRLWRGWFFVVVVGAFCTIFGVVVVCFSE